ncbi:MAG TPA: phage tail tape measure protein [Allocoleopsis sp.]
MAETEGVIRLIAEDKGLSKVFKAGTKSVELLNDQLDEGIDRFKDYKEQANLAEKTLSALTKTTDRTIDTTTNAYRGLTATYRNVTSAAEKTIAVGDALDGTMVSLTSRVLGLHSELSGVNSVLQPAASLFADVSDQTSAFGKAAVILHAAARPLQGVLKGVGDVTAKLAISLASMGETGQVAGEMMLGFSDSLYKAANALKFADAIAGTFLMIQRFKEFVEDVGPAAIDTVKTLYDVTEQMGVKQMLFGDRMKTTMTVARVVSFTQKGLTKSVADYILQLNELGEAVAPYKAIAQAAYEAYIRSKNLNETFSAFKAIGIDTTYAELAVEIGELSTSLLTSAEAAQRFVNITVGAFAQLEDKLNFVRTLSSGASANIDELGQSMIDLVSGPLANSVKSTEAAAALYNTLSAGIGSTANGMTDMAAASKAMEAGLKLAASTGTEAATSMDALYRYMTAYKISSRDAAKTAAQLNAVVDEGMIMFPQLAGGIGRVAGVAKQAGISSEELLASITTLSYTMSSDDAMTGYASLIQAIAGQGAQASQSVKELGIQFDTQTVKSKGLVKSLQDLYKASGGNIEKLKEIIPDSLAFSTALTLMTASGDKTTAMMAKIKDTGEESLDALFGRSQQSLIKQANALMNGFQEIMADFGQRVLPLLEPGIKFLNEILEKLQQMPEPLKNTIASIVMLNLAMNKSVDIVKILIGSLFQMATSYLMMRGIQLIITKQFFNEVGAIRALIRAKADYMTILLRVFGIERTAAGEIVFLTKAQGLQVKTNEALTKQRQLGIISLWEEIKANLANRAATNGVNTVGQQSIRIKVAQAIANARESIQITFNTISTRLNANAKNAGAAATTLWTAVTNAASAATGLLTGAVNVATIAFQAFWATMGPITVALGAIVAAFMALQDLVPALGGSAGDMKSLADGLDKIAMKAENATEKQKKLNASQQEYTGNINKTFLPLMERLFRNIGAPIAVLSRIPVVSKKIDDAFTNAKDAMQNYIEAPVWEALEGVDERLNQQFENTINKTITLKSGKFVSDRAKEIKAAADAAGKAMTSDEMKTALEEDNKVIQKRINSNQELISQLEEQANAQGVTEKIKNQIQERIDALKQETSAFENAARAQQLYIQNLNAIEQAIEDNDTAKSAEKISKKLKESLENALKQIPDNMKDTFKEVYADLEKGMNLTGASQRRRAVQIINALNNFADNAKRAADTGNQQDLNALREDAKTLLESLDAGRMAGTLSDEFVSQLKQDLTGKLGEIELPSGKKGLIWSADFFDQINSDVGEATRRMGDRQIREYSNTAANIQTLLAKREIGEQEATSRTLQNDADAAKSKLETERNVLNQIKTAQGEASDAYKDQLKSVTQLEQEEAQKRAAVNENTHQNTVKKQQREAENAATKTINSRQKELNTSELQNKKLELQNNLLSSRQKLEEAYASLEASRLQNRIKMTNDVAQRARLERQAAELNLKHQDEAYARDKESLVLQNKINLLAIDREKISNKIAVAENTRALALARIELIEAKREHRTQEEIDAIDLQIASLTEQGNLLKESGTMLEKNRNQQVQINESAEKELNVRHQQTREGGLLDIQLSKEQEVTAEIEARNREWITSIELRAQLEKQAMDALTQSIQRQSSVLDLHKQELESIKGFVESEAQIIIETTRLRGDRKRVEEDLAKFQFDTLRQTQEMERENLRIQQMQRDVALQRQQIENDVAKAKNYAEQQKLAADLQQVQDRRSRGQATDAEVRAAEAALYGSQIEGAGLAYADVGIAAQRNVNQMQSAQENRAMQISQRAAENQAFLNWANSSRRPGDRRRRRQEARSRAMEDIYGTNKPGQGFDESLFAGVTKAPGSLANMPSFDAFFQQFMGNAASIAQEFMTPSSGLMVPTLSQPVTQRPGQIPIVSQAAGKKQPAMPLPSPAVTAEASTIQVDAINIEITIDGAPGDAQGYSTIVRQGVQDGIRDLIDEARRRRGIT